MTDPTKDAPWFDFYPERWTHGTRGLTKVERCDYLDLLLIQWTEGALPDLDTIAVALGYTTSAGKPKVKDIPAKVLAKFPVGDDGLRRNLFMERIRAEQRERIAKKRAQRKAAADARWHPKPSGGNADASVPHIPPQCGEDAPHTPHSTLHLVSTPPAGAGEPVDPDPGPDPERIAAAWGLAGNPMHVLPAIHRSLASGKDTAAQILKATQQCAVNVRQYAPQGFNSQFVPKALAFFENEDWRNPGQFVNRWKPRVNGSQQARGAIEAAAAALDRGATVQRDAEDFFTGQPAT